MKTTFSSVLLSLLYWQITIAQICDPSGNVVIFSNYDGSKEITAGRLNINVDANIPNLKIGICSYGRVTVNIAGTYAANVTKVIYAGYNDTTNCNCYYPSKPAGCTATTVVTGVAAGIISYIIMPSATYSDPNGYNSIDCVYQCAGGNQGGCNTPEQVVNYFLSAFGAGSVFRSHETQYACWNGVTKSISLGGNCCLASALPVELISFEANCLNPDRVFLKWSTASEINNDYFSIERSANGTGFDVVGMIKGTGNSTQLINYNWTDNSPLPGINYYRLKQTDFDGRFNYSNPVSVKGNCGDTGVQLNLVNNPVNGVLLFQLKAADLANTTVEVYDIYGKAVINAQVPTSDGNNLYSLHVNSIAKGIYFLRVITNSCTTQQKFIKQ